MRRRRTRLLLAVAVVTTSFAVPASGAADCANVVRRPDGWRHAARPEFSRGGAAIVDYEVEAYQSDRIYVSNGHEVWSTSDGACTWEHIYSAGITLVSGGGESALDVTVEDLSDVVMIGLAQTRSAGDRLYLLVTDSVRDTPLSPVVRRPRVVVSEDRGETWSDGSTGLPAVGDPMGLWIAPTNADVGYALVADPAGARRLYATTDGGASWTAQQELTATPPRIRFVAVDPLDPADLWLYGEAGLLRSTDSGRTATAVREVPAPVFAVAVERAGTGAGDRVVAMSAPRPEVYQSFDAGRSWSVSPGVPLTVGATIAPQGDRFAYTAGGRAYVVSRGFVYDVTPYRTLTFEPRFARAPGNRLFVASGGGVLWRDVVDAPVPPPSQRPTLPPVNLTPPKLRKPGEPVLLPSSYRLDLAVGEVARVPYVLDLPRTPTPLDVMLVFDSTRSMDPLFAGLRNGIQRIVNDLSAQRVNGWFGLADFREYPRHPKAVLFPDNFPYRLRRPVGPVNEELEEAIESVHPDQGTQDGRTSALEAIYQAATGLGRTVALNTGIGPYHIQPGQGAGWRRETLKIVLIATDIEMRKPGLPREVTYPGPSIAQVTAALNRRHVQLIGLDLGDGLQRDLSDGAEPEFVPDGSADLNALAKGTGTLAPSDGADCDGDGDADVGYGQPLVCALPLHGAGTRLADAILGLLDAVQDLQPVQLDVVAPPGVAAVVEPARHEAVDVKDDNRLPWNVDVTCLPEHVGTVVPVLVEARVRGTLSSTATLDVACAVPPANSPSDAPDMRLPRAAVVVPPPPPAQPVVNADPNPHPNINPNPQYQPQAQVNAQAGAATQEERQAQLATLWLEEQGRMDVEELAMSRRDEPDPAALALLGTMTVVAAAGAVAESRRRTSRPALVLARVRSRRR